MESINIQQAVSSVLQVVSELGGKYGKEYVSKVLKGEKSNCRQEHQQIKSFGVLHDWTYSKITFLMEYLYSKEYLSLQEVFKGKYIISERGKKYLEKASEFWIYEFQLKPSRRHYYYALRELKAERKNQADALGVPAYELCSNYQIEQLIELDIKSMEELERHEIFKNWESKLDWEMMIMTLRKAKKDYYAPTNLKERRNYTVILEAVHQKKKIQQICEDLKIKVRTLVNYVEAFHENGEEHLKEWIYANMQRGNLAKCIEYFTRTQDLKLKPAKEQLGLDYETLRLGRIYYLIQKTSIAA